MKLRHVRSVAVLGVVMIALTGARGSGGGGCGGGSSHSGSGDSGGTSGGSSSTGGYDSSSGSGTSGGYDGSTSSGGTSGSHSDSSGSGGSSGVTVPGSSSSHRAMRDVKIDECRMDASGRNLTARITVTNSGSLDYTYDVTLQFKGATGDPNVHRAVAEVDDLLVRGSGSRTATASTPYTGSGDGSEYTRCAVINVFRDMA
ncbi:hypothetical protein [Streptomyces sp. NPDC050856]|uniref:hypothetical protein n=1 Tax=Streptomyces sp. NPDC050856 TaxID=3154939 RepID=UPI0033CC0F4D